jgi:hypothetical protein
MAAGRVPESGNWPKTGKQKLRRMKSVDVRLAKRRGSNKVQPNRDQEDRAKSQAHR